jgi:hypothetical protein
VAKRTTSPSYTMSNEPLASNSTIPSVRPPPVPLPSLPSIPASSRPHLSPSQNPDLPHGRTPYSHSNTTPSIQTSTCCPPGNSPSTTTLTFTTQPSFALPTAARSTTLSGPRTRHLYQLFLPELTHRAFEEEVYLFITRLGSRSEIHSPTPATTTRKRWVTREDPLSALRNTFHAQTEFYSDPGARRRRSGGGPGEGCARRPSAPTSTSTRWALVTP